MENHKQPEKVEVQEEEAQMQEDPPQLVNVQDQQPIVNGHVQPVPDPDPEILLLPNQILELDNHYILNLEDIVEQMRADGDPSIDVEEIQRLLAAIGFLKDGEEDSDEHNDTPCKENPLRRRRDDDDDDSSDESDTEPLAAMIIVGMVESN